MPSQIKTQLAMDETIVEDEELEAALEERQKRADSLGALRKRYREADERAKTAIRELIPEDSIARVGRFRVTRKNTPGRHVEFDAKAGERVAITTTDES